MLRGLKDYFEKPWNLALWQSSFFTKNMEIVLDNLNLTVISMRVLIGQHSNLQNLLQSNISQMSNSSQVNNNFPSSVHSVVSKVKVGDIVKAAAEDATFICSEKFAIAPPVNIYGPIDTHLVNIPQRLKLMHTLGLCGSSCSLYYVGDTEKFDESCN